MGCTQSVDQDDTERVMHGRKGIGASERIRTHSERVNVIANRVLSANQANQEQKDSTAPTLNDKGELTQKEVAKRISGSFESRDCTLGKVGYGSSDDVAPGDIINVSYAVLTQRGYYPDNPHKANQDAFHVTSSKFAGGEGDAMFCIFDGHGDNGHDCADFAKQNFAPLVAANVKKHRAALNAERLRDMTKKGEAKPNNAFHPCNWPYLSGLQYEEAVKQATLKVNTTMQAAKHVKAKMSGTTAISVAFHAGRINVSNVGDSRVVLGYRREVKSTPAEEEKTEIIEDDTRSSELQECSSSKAGSLLAIPLSEDQTPYRKDERERLKKAGARICSIDQMEGIEPMHENWGEMDLGVDIDVTGDPPRVWLHDHDYPGTAFSRSLGDDIGEDVGVTADPEFVTKEITKGDEILVIASDGVFEFLTNQQVIDICASSDNPQQACARLLEESYKQWLHYELRTDDITCIVLFLKNTKENDDEVMRKLTSRQLKVKKMKKETKRESSVPKLANGAAAELTNGAAAELTNGVAAELTKGVAAELTNGVAAECPEQKVN